LEATRATYSRKASPKLIQRKIAIPILIETIETRGWTSPFAATDPTVSVSISIFHDHFGTILRTRR